MQVGGTGNTANGAAVVNVQLEETINDLKEAINESDEIESLEKEDAVEALDKTASLAKREPSQGVGARLKKSIDTITEVVEKGQKLAVVAIPLISEIKKHFPWLF